MSTVRSIERRLYVRRQDDRDLRTGHGVAGLQSVVVGPWNGLWQGYMVMLGVAILLVSLTMGIGLSTVTATSGTSWLHMGRGVTIWSIISVLIALFVGSWVAARGPANPSHSHGIARGITLWGMTMGTLLALVLWLGSMAATAAATAAAGAANVAANVAANAANNINGAAAGSVASHAGSSVAWGVFWLTLIGLGVSIFGGAIGSGGPPRRKGEPAPAPAGR